MSLVTISHLLSSQAYFSKVNFSGSLCNNRVRLRYNVRLSSRISSGQNLLPRRRSSIFCMSGSEIASNTFTWGTLAVLPFYAFMIAAPNAKITKKVVSSSLPYMILGTSYAVLLSLSWTQDTIPLMFSSKYLLPELEGIAKMFSSEMTLASAWIHLLVVDLFAARQVYFDGLENEVETRHSVCLCLLFCPVGILAHFITKNISTSTTSTRARGNIEE